MEEELKTLVQNNIGKLISSLLEKGYMLFVKNLVTKTYMKIISVDYTSNYITVIDDNSFQNLCLDGLHITQVPAVYTITLNQSSIIDFTSQIFLFDLNFDDILIVEPTKLTGKKIFRDFCVELKLKGEKNE